LVQKLAQHLSSRRIYACDWGHEHHCVVYDEHPAYGLRGRCIGHSGFPEFRKSDWGAAPAETSWHRLKAITDSPAGYVLDGRNDFIPKHETEYVPHGYVTLEIENDKMTEFIHQPDGKRVDLP
jgi:hypothetical protein